MFGKIHQSVTVKSHQYLAELSRHNYVTPTSYLELLGTFKKVLGIKKNEILTAKNRTKTGLDKVAIISIQINLTLGSNLQNTYALLLILLMADVKPVILF